MNKWERPVYPVFMPFSKAAAYAMDIFSEIDDKMTGSIGMDKIDASILAEAVFLGGGSYLEIGSLYGGSAILAAKVMKQFNIPGRVTCVDDLEMLGKDHISENIKLFGVDDMIDLRVAKSNAAGDLSRQAVTLVDASHDYGWCTHDIELAKVITDSFILVHDYDSSHPDVLRASRNAIDPNWLPVAIVNHMFVLKKERL